MKNKASAVRYVVTIDQQDSRSQPDRVPELLDALKQNLADGGVEPLVPCERTIGDEVQVLLDDADGVVVVLRTALRMGGWHVGIGVGAIEAIPPSVREGRGQAFVSAREAVEESKKQGRPIIRSAAKDLSVACSVAEALADFLAITVRQRTRAQVDVVAMLDDGLGGKQIGEELGITASAVSQRRAASRYDLEQRGWASLAAALTLEPWNSRPEGA